MSPRTPGTPPWNRTRKPAPTRSPATRALLVTALAVLVLLGAATATPWQFHIPDVTTPARTADLPDISAPPQPTAMPPQDPTGSHTLTVIAVVLTALGAALLAVLLYLVARRVLRSLGRPVEDDDPDAVPAGGSLGADTAPAIPLSELQDAVQRALSRVDTAATPHDAVVAAWVALEDAAAEHGTTRDPAQTPTEFTSEILAATPAPPADLDTLRHLYGQARFTPRPVGPDQVAHARDALRRIADALDAPGHPAPAPAPGLPSHQDER